MLTDASRTYPRLSQRVQPGGSISVGFARLRESDSAETLIHRADEDLLALRASS